jgi:ATP-dependent DNA helicase DinG
MLTPADILGPSGSIAARLKQYEHRPEQLQMAEAVARSLAEGRHLVVEAGTGVGKSFAYLVPSILAAVGEAPLAASHEGDDDDIDDERRKKNGQPQKRRIVVSTHTISLQEQLVAKDLPFLKTVVPAKFTAALSKGRRNYVSLRRLSAAASRARFLFYDASDLKQVAELVAWSKTTKDGSLSDLSFKPSDAVWDEAASDTGNCMGKQCPRYADCFYFAARKRLAAADILIVNHALFFTDLLLREKNVRLLPKYDAVIFDEAHTLEAVAADHLGLGITSGQVVYSLNKLSHERREDKGLLAVFPSKEVSHALHRCRQTADAFFAAGHALAGGYSGRSQRINKPDSVNVDLPGALDELAAAVENHEGGIGRKEERQDFLAVRQRLAGLAAETRAWVRQSLEEAVYWVESGQSRRGRPTITFAAAPVDVGPALKRMLFDSVASVVLTSATLSIGKSASFDFFQSRIGLEGARQVRLGSPFNFKKQARLILLEGMPDPSQKERYDELCCAMIRRYVARTDGRAFVLFTSHQSMRSATGSLSPWFTEQGMTLISQSDGLPRGQMVERFKSEPRAVLFGTDSFWQGVDVPGEALQNVIITKLPFTAPDQPLLEARLDAIRKAGGNPFFDYQLPEAVIKLRQGFGRLIRTQRDKGIVVLFDPRVRGKPYGRTFLESLPECEVVIEKVEGSEK